MTKLIETEPESQSWLEGRARRRRERIKSERAFLRAKQQHRETTKIQNRGSNPLGFFSTSMSPSRATLDQKHGPSSLPHAFCFFLSFCLHHSLSLLRKKNRRILSPHKCDRIVSLTEWKRISRTVLTPALRLRLPRPPPRSRRWCCRWWCVFLLGGLLLA